MFEFIFQQSSWVKAEKRYTTEEIYRKAFWIWKFPTERGKENFFREITVKFLRNTNYFPVFLFFFGFLRDSR